MKTAKVNRFAQKLTAPKFHFEMGSKVFGLKLTRQAAAKQVDLAPRAYTDGQIGLLCRNALPELALSIQVAAAAGLRAAELDTIMPLEKFAEDRRPWLANRFVGREDEVRFGVNGKGGLRREVRLPRPLADQIEQRRLNIPSRILDREIFHIKHFDLLGGQEFSDAFSTWSKRILGWSTGAHGLRHRFAQSRLLALQLLGFEYDDALLILSQELGHFSFTNTLSYIR